MKSKAELREELSKDIELYLVNNVIIDCVKQKKKVRSECKGKEKKYFKYRSPMNRPNMNWDIIC